MKRLYSRRVLLELVCGFLVVLAIPILSNRYVTNRLSNTLLELRRSEYENKLSHAANLIDYYLSGATYVTLQIAMNNSVLRLLNYATPSYASSVIYQFRQASTALATYDLKDLEHHTFVLLRKPDFVIQARKAFSDIALFYQDSMQVNEMSFSDWVSLYMNTHHNMDVLLSQNWLIRGKATKCISILQSIPLMKSIEGPQGVAVVLVNQDAFLSMIKDKIGEDDSILMMYDNKGYAILGDERGSDDVATALVQATKNKAPIVAHNQLSYAAFYQSLSVADIKLAFYLPTLSITNAVSLANRVHLIATLVSILLGMSATILFSYRHYRPIRSIGNLLPGTHVSGYAELTRGVSDLLHESDTLRAFAEDQKRVMTDLFLDKLFDEQFRDTEQMSSVLLTTSLDQTPGVLIVVAVAFAESVGTPVYGVLGYTRFQFANLLANTFGTDCHIYDIDMYEMAMLITGHDSSQAFSSKVIEGIRGISNRLSKLNVLETSFGVGVCQDGNYLNASLSFRQARQILHAVTSGVLPGPVAVANSTIPDRGLYAYPINLEIRLLSAMRSGAVDSLKSDIDQLMSTNFSKRRMSVRMHAVLNRMLAGTILRLSEETVNLITDEDQVILDDVLHNTESLLQAKYHTGRICKLMIEIGERSRNRAGELSQSTLKSICDAVEKRYCDPNLTSALLAEEYHLSESYFPQYFRKHMGISFSDYLESIRLSNAIKLLDASSCSVEKVSRSVGYSSSHTFRRSFKRRYGISPTLYRGRKNTIS